MINLMSYMSILLIDRKLTGGAVIVRQSGLGLRVQRVVKKAMQGWVMLEWDVV